MKLDTHCLRNDGTLSKSWCIQHLYYNIYIYTFEQDGKNKRTKIGHFYWYTKSMYIIYVRCSSQEPKGPAIDSYLLCRASEQPTIKQIYHQIMSLDTETNTIWWSWYIRRSDTISFCKICICEVGHYQLIEFFSGLCHILVTHLISRKINKLQHSIPLSRCILRNEYLHQSSCFLLLRHAMLLRIYQQHLHSLFPTYICH